MAHLDVVPLVEFPDLPYSLEPVRLSIQDVYSALQAEREKIYRVLSANNSLPPFEVCPMATLMELVKNSQLSPHDDRPQPPIDTTKYFHELDSIHSLVERGFARTRDSAIQKWRLKFDVVFAYFPNEE